MRYHYDLLGNRIHQASMEAGERWLLNDITGKPIRTWDSRGFIRRMTYDLLRRPIGLYVTENGTERLAERTVYGDSLGLENAKQQNHLTRVYQVYDAAGIVTSESFDFKGNLSECRRDLLPNYKTAVDWLQNPTANDGTYTSSTQYDALNRPINVIAPDNSVYRPTYNKANLLNKVDVNLRGATTDNGEKVWTAFVTNIDYNAKGQRTLIQYGNRTTTTYEYDEQTFRLIRLATTREDNQNNLANQLFADSHSLQNLYYTYDPAGNITRIEDAALIRVFNHGIVDPQCQYHYDALYRLIEAQGREHAGQAAWQTALAQANRRDYPFVGASQTNNLNDLRNYAQTYVYDEVGNFQTFKHNYSNGGWTRTYDYSETSLLQTGLFNNRLSRSTVSNGNNTTETYGYTAQNRDVHGCMTAINQMELTWDFEDQLQRIDLGGGGTAYYVYDAGGQRIRKVIETQNGTRQKERIYLGGYEIYREYNPSAGSGQAVTLERTTLHVMDDKQRIALVETLTIENSLSLGKSARPRLRYQLGNHLGSASLELDEAGQLISYEEYHPYGTTAFQASRSGAEVSAKRYRYTGMEGDEESGLAYHSARYYLPWLGRWGSCDPVGITNVNSLYNYTESNPVIFIDDDGKSPKSTRGGGTTQKETTSLIEEIIEETLKKEKEGGAEIIEEASKVLDISKEKEKLKEQKHRRSKKPIVNLRKRTSPSSLGDGFGEWEHITPKDILKHHERQYKERGSNPRRWKNPQGYEAGHPYNEPFVTHGDKGGPMQWERPADNNAKDKVRKGHRPGKNQAPLPDTKINKVGKKAVKRLPIIKFAPAAYDVYEAFQRGDYGEAGQKFINATPVVGDVLDAFMLGYEIGELITEKIDEHLNRPKYEEVAPILQNPIGRNQRALKERLLRESKPKEPELNKDTTEPPVLEPKELKRMPNGFLCS